MKERALFLWKFYLSTVAMFMAAKVAFMVLHSGRRSFSVGDVLAVLYHGLSLDLSTSLYVLIVPFLLCVASLWMVVPRRPFRIYNWFLAVFFGLVFVADTTLYSFWQFKLDATCLHRFATSTDFFGSMSLGYVLLRVAIWIVVAAIILYSYSRINTRFQPVRHRVLGSLIALLLVPFYVIGTRGGIDESTTNIGQVYFSQNQFLNHSAVNPVFSYLASFEKSANNIDDYDYFSQSACDRLMKGLYPVSSVSSDTLLNNQRPDIVVILMESAGEVIADAMPRLQRLKEEGVYFSACYGNTWRTDCGTVCTWSGYPSFPRSSVMKMPGKTRNLPSIANTLKSVGYQTHYFFGGDINFANMRSYLIGTGFAELTWKKDFTVDEQNTSVWGVRDDIMFDAVFDQLMSGDGQHPQLIGFSTLSSHEPWDVPHHYLDDPAKNAFYYLDDCIGRFVEKLKGLPQWKKTLLVLIPDHSISWGDTDELQRERNRIPMLWLGGAVKAPAKIDKLCNQTDLAATLLSQLRLPHDDFAWSRDILSRSYTYPFAVHSFTEGFTVTDSTGFLVYDFKGDRVQTSQSYDTLRLENMAKAILQATTKDLKEK